MDTNTEEEIDASAHEPCTRDCAKAAIVCAGIGFITLFEPETWVFGLVFSIFGFLIALVSIEHDHLGLSLGGALFSVLVAIISGCLLFYLGFVPSYV